MRDVLRGRRVRLTALCPRDLPVIASWRQDARLLRQLDALPAAPSSEAQIAKRIEDTQASGSGFIFAIRPLGANPNTLLGYLEFDGILWSQGVTGASMAIDPEEQGKGYGSEALALGLRFAFHELNLRRVQLTVFAYNTRAISLYERLGFVREGVYREFLERDGSFHDMLLYGLLRREWEARLRNE